MIGSGTVSVSTYHHRVPYIPGRVTAENSPSILLIHGSVFAITKQVRILDMEIEQRMTTVQCSGSITERGPENPTTRLECWEQNSCEQQALDIVSVVSQTNDMLPRTAVMNVLVAIAILAKLNNTI